MQATARTLFAVLFTALLVPLSAVAQEKRSQPDPATVKALNELAMKWQQLAAANDAAGVAALYTPDARFYNESMAVQGTDALRGAFTAMFPAMKDMVIKSDPDVLMMGDVAISTGTYEAKLTGANEGQKIAGNWMTVGVRQPNGTWKIARHMDVPLPATKP